MGYPFMKEVPWNSGLYNINPGSADAVAVTKAIGKMIAMGAQMDPKLLAAGADAHHKAIQGLPANGVCSEAQLTAINAAIGRMIASVPESTTMGVYDAVSSIVDPKVPAYLMSTVKEADARAAYAALIDFTSVVKANPITSSSPSASSNPAIDAAAVKLSAAAYPFIEGMDAKGVLSQADFQAINAGLGKAIASAGTSATMDVYNAMASLVGSSPVPNYLFSKVNPQDAIAAYNGLLEFKDVVKAAQR